MRRSGLIRAVLVCIALGVVSAPGVFAQNIGMVQSPILTIESDRLFAESAFGQRAAQDYEAASAVLAAENRRIEAELMAEEQELTERRAEMDPTGFRALADAFDEKVQTIRREQDGKARALQQSQEASRGTFLRAAAPVLEALMIEAGAAVILERSSVFLSANVSDITDLALERINETLGTGQQDPAEGQD